MNILAFRAAKHQRKLVMTTCYDYWSAQLIAETNVDAVLVGDSVVMVMHGEKTTIPATVDLIALHTKAVAQGIGDKLLIADMPFLSTNKGVQAGIEAAEVLMRAGAHAVKIEGNSSLDVIRTLIQAGIPVMGHLGLTPQSIHQLGGWKVQGKNTNAVDALIEQAQQLEEVGCFSIVLECMPSRASERLTKALAIPTIGIGAGPQTDGQILVLQDLLGTNIRFKPKFVRTYLNGAESIQRALHQYAEEVRAGLFPSEAESYGETS